MVEEMSKWTVWMAGLTNGELFLLTARGGRLVTDTCKLSKPLPCVYVLAGKHVPYCLLISAIHLARGVCVGVT